MKRLATIAAAAALLMTTNAYAINLCQEQTIVTPDTVVIGATYVASTTTGKDGWDGTGGKCSKPGSDAVWVGPRDAHGVCLTPASLIGTAGSQTLAKHPDTIIDVPDIDQHRIGLVIHGNWIGTPWLAGDCP